METKGSTLIAKQSRIVTRQELANIPTPLTTRTYRAVPFIDLVHVIEERLAHRGLTIEREQLAVNPSNTKLFGVLDLERYGSNNEYGGAIGFRTSHDKSLAIHIVAGARVFVCDNLALTGQSVLVRAAHYRSLSLNYSIDSGLDRYFKAARAFDQHISALKTVALDNEAAKVLFFDLFHSGTLSQTLFNEVASNYFRAHELQYADCEPRTLWGAHNACTRALKGAPPQAGVNQLQRVGAFFEHEVDSVPRIDR